MRTSRTSKETAKVLQALSPPPARRQTRSTSHSNFLREFAYNGGSNEENPVKKEDDDSSLSSIDTIDIEDILEPPAKRRKTKTSTVVTTASTTEIKVEKVVKNESTPQKARRVPARKIKREDGSLAVEPPSNWESMYSMVKKMREANPTAPVDTMGCAELYWRASSPRDRRFQTLIALMLSSQTKDTVTAVAMQRLHTQLGDGDASIIKQEVEEDSRSTSLPIRDSTLNLENILAVAPERLNSLIGTVGFHNNKTKYIKKTAEILRDQYNSDIPSTPAELMKLPGVGPKMAFLCMSAAWGKHEGIGVDVHVHRITNLWGWHKTKTPEETRMSLESWLPKDRWHEINKLLVGLGQTVCLPVGRRCGDCVLAGTKLCKSEIKGMAPKNNTQGLPKKEEEIFSLTAPSMAPQSPISIPLFAEAQQQLLLKEHNAEVSSSALASTASASPSTRRTLQATGHALTGIILSQCRTGLGGRLVGEFTADSAILSSGKESEDVGVNGKLRLGAHGIRVGDIVRVNEVAGGAGKKGVGKEKEKEKAKAKAEVKAPEGVVTRVGESSVWVAFGQRGGGERSREEDEVLEEFIKLANDVTYRRMNQTMEKMGKMTESDHTHFLRVAFGHATPLQPDYEEAKAVEFLDPTLNDSQKEAIRFALASRDIALIHGPPGTGKTHTLIELITQMVKRNLRVLVCGPSNISVDNIVERLGPNKIPVVRIGHPARLLPSVLDHSLEALTQTSDAAAIVRDVRKEIDEKQASIRKTRFGREKRAIYQDLKELRREYRQRESKCVDNLIRESNVVLATLHGAGGHQLKNQKFDVVIIDEASQALEAQCWISLLNAPKVVLAGDHLQLPPTVKTTTQKEKEAPQNGEKSEVGKFSLETTLFDRLLSMHGPGIKRMLTTQYRMHEKIMRFPSDELYESKLVAAESVRSRLLKDLPYEVQDTDDTREPVVFWDTQGADFPEKVEDEDITKKQTLLGESKINEMEALVVARHVENLIQAGVRPEDIAVITPYNGQLAVLSQMLREKYPGLELGSVDGFQGREKEAVVVSLVRSNSEQEVGFLGEKRRLNGSGFLKRWMAHLEEHSDLRYPDAGELL
ncbi:hypothetical protein BDV12DRAFT_181840 [Aspergillus spectabilis]